METGDENTTLLTHDKMQCFVKRVLATIVPYMFISHTKMSILLTAWSWAKHGSCFARCLSICFLVLSVTTTKLPLGQTLNPVTFDAYMPRTAEALTHGNRYGYCFLYSV